MGWGSNAPDRVNVRDLPGELVATVEPAGVTDAGSERYSWQFDSYGIVKVTVYAPAGETLPAGGVVFMSADEDPDEVPEGTVLFNPAMGEHRPQRGRRVSGASLPPSVVDGKAIRVYVEGPASFPQFKSVTVVHA